MSANNGEATESYQWVAYSADVLVCWYRFTRPGGPMTRRMVALLVYGDVSSRNVRAIPVGLIHSADPDSYPNWVTPAPHGYGLEGMPPAPDMVQVYDAWAPRLPDPWDEVDPDPDSEETVVLSVKLGPRGATETVDEFYARVADAYRIFAARGDGRPTSTIAEASGVQKNTAARWVHEARRRGHLPPTTKGRVSR